ncbi:MAG: SIMPL domain-containing protein [Candidatus Binataceae bacterium]
MPAASAAILGALVAIGLALGGYFIEQGFLSARGRDRYVTARGLVERSVKADVAVWNIAFTATNDDVTKANAEIDRDAKLVTTFAHDHGFTASEIETIATKVTDTQQYGGNQMRSNGRYLVKGGIRIRSSNVDRVAQTGQLTGDLIRQGIVLNLEPDSGIANPAYYFTQLDSIRPAMLAEATKSARAVAQQFANDSSSKLGPIRRANQGVFEILPRDASGSQNSFDEARSIDKKVRLVSTIDYYLEE